MLRLVQLSPPARIEPVLPSGVQVVDFGGQDLALSVDSERDGRALVRPGRVTRPCEGVEGGRPGMLAVTAADAEPPEQIPNDSRTRL
jgi:hypothetical protein